MGGTLDDIRLLATDLDGTLLRSDGTVSDRTRRTLRRAEAEGLVVVMVTGRSSLMMEGLAAELGCTGTAICSNGSLLYDLDTGTIISEIQIMPDVGADVVAAVRAALPDAVFAVDAAGGFSREDGWEVRDAMSGREVRVAQAEELVVTPVTKILARIDDADPDELVTVVARAIGPLAIATRSTSWGLIEIGAAGVSKASSLERFAGALGIAAAEVVAVGDMPNDLPMLDWAGRSAAVANAHESVLAAVDLVLPGNDDDGVAVLVDSILDDRRRA